MLEAEIWIFTRNTVEWIFARNVVLPILNSAGESKNAEIGKKVRYVFGEEEDTNVGERE